MNWTVSSEGPLEERGRGKEEDGLVGESVGVEDKYEVTDLAMVRRC